MFFRVDTHPCAQCFSNKGTSSCVDENDAMWHICQNILGLRSQGPKHKDKVIVVNYAT